MLDYAANAVVHWPVEAIRGRLEARCAEADLDPEVELGPFLNGGTADEFWSAVKTNLQAGKVRLIFIADVIPPELRRIVEFLNVQMDPAEVLALEIRQYVGEGLRTLVPRVIGRTAEAERKKAAASGTSRVWDEASFFATLREKAGADATGVARQIFAWAGRKGRVWFGKGSRSGSFGLAVRSKNGKERYLLSTWTTGVIEISFYWLKNGPPFDDELKRRELLARLNAIDGVSLAPEAADRRPNMRLTAFVVEHRIDQLLEALDWAVSEIESPKIKSTVT